MSVIRKTGKKMKNEMLTGSPGKSLFFFALPMIIGNLFQQFYNMADTIIVGQCVGEDALAAVGASYSLTTVFIMVAIGGGIGASVLTSQYLGAKEHGKMKTSIYTAFISFLVLSILMAVFGEFFSPAILRALKTPENIFGDAVLYLQIYFLGMPFLFMYNILTSTFNALGESRIPLYLLIFSSILNIILDLFLILQFHMGVAGAAAATVFAQGVSAVISFGILKKRLKRYLVNEEERTAVYDVQMFCRGTRIAIPSIVQQSIVSIGMLLVQSVVNGFGSSVLAGYSAGSRVESICIVPMIATGNAVSTFTAQNLGAGQPERAKQGYRAAYKIVLSVAVVICVVINLFHNKIIQAFIESGGGRAFETGNSYIMFLGWFFVLIGLKAATDGVLRGAGDVGMYMTANLVNLGIRVAVANLLAPVWGVQAVWYAVPMGWLANYLISFFWYLTGRWSKKRLIR